MQEALRELRRERRQKEKAFKKKKREEEKRRKIYEPKSVKIQFIGQEVLQQVRENKSGSSSKSNQQPKSKKDVKIEPSYPEYRAQKALGFLDEEYPSLTKSKQSIILSEWRQLYFKIDSSFTVCIKDWNKLNLIWGVDFRFVPIFNTAQGVSKATHLKSG